MKTDVRECKRLRFRSVAACLMLAGSALAIGEVTKIALPSDSGLRFVWWPEMTVPANWEQDYDSSVANAINLLVPTGQNFSNAETIIYGRASYRDQANAPATFDEFIENDFIGHRSFDPDVKIEKTAPSQIADGTQLDSYTFFPGDEGNWEKVAYGEDGQFYLIFVLSSRSRQGYRDALADFETAVSSYTREPEEMPQP